MTMRKYADLLASVGEFEDSDGRKAKRWTRVGVMMRDDRSGAWSIKIDCIPVGPHWSGWLAVRNVDKEDPAAGADSAGEQVSGIR
jgi:hypothetical protein